MPQLIRMLPTMGHNSNLWYAIPQYIFIVFQTLSAYGTHLFIRELGKKFDSGSISVSAENPEKYISFNIKVIIDEYEMSLGEINKLRDSCISLTALGSCRVAWTHSLGIRLGRTG